MKKPKFQLHQKIYISYGLNIESKKITGIIYCSDKKYKYILDNDTSFYYHEDKLYENKDIIKKKLLEQATIDYLKCVEDIGEVS